ncbi:MAG: alpha/beta fold hydrolase [Verrucomicrobia bacterium]|nr:alpha/beta fold hydrolase [Verrucomicrobiota bacterium]
MRLVQLAVLSVALSTLAAAAQDTNRLTVLQRVEPARLKAVHEAREKFARERQPVPEFGLYDDFRAVIHVHAEDSDHTKGTRDEVLAAAKKTGVRIVMFTDHRGPKPDTWRGLRDGVLFFAGSETGDGELWFPEFGADGKPIEKSGLRFLSHIEERYDAGTDGFAGMEIVNRHTDAKLDKGLHLYLLAASADDTRWAQLVENFHNYPDELFGAGSDYRDEIAAKWDREIAARKFFTGIGANDAHQNQQFKGVTFDPYEVSFRNLSTHVFAQELSEAAVREALRAGRCYVAHDWLCDPTGFGFACINNLGTFSMGDSVPLGIASGHTRFVAQAPVPARYKLFHDGKIIADRIATRFEHSVKDKEQGSYRLEAWLNIAGEDRPWIYANAIYVGASSLGGIRMAPLEAPGVEQKKNIRFAEDGGPENANKQMLDVYWPKDVKNAPVYVFLHGGAWRYGDRNLYPSLGTFYARHGIVCVVPSYRLAPKNPWPAQIDDAASAFAWTVKNIAQFGGDPARIYIGGHSAGGHLSALLALNSKHLERHGLSPKNVRGVLCLSGVYDLNFDGLSTVFGKDPAVRREATPLTFVKAPAPPFLVSYCQYDYFSLPAQARVFDRALRKAGIASQLIYTPGENHIMEAFAFMQEDNATAKAILNFIK